MTRHASRLRALGPPDATGEGGVWQLSHNMHRKGMRTIAMGDVPHTHCEDAMATRKPKPTPTMSRRATERVLAATMPTADLYTRRGKCLACGNRWAVVRVVLTMTSAARVERYATHECSRCGHTWRRVAATMPIQTGGGTQRVRLSLILPSNTLRTWHSHGVWHRDGDDSASIIDATFADVDEAYAEWTKRNGTYTAKLERARVKRETERAASHEATMATLARWAERDAERAADEAAAAAREAATA